MRTSLRRWLALGVALTLATVLANASPALASVPYNGVCGDGYNVNNSAAITGGTIYLTYNNTNGRNCVVVIRADPGAAMTMDAVLKHSDATSWRRDPGEWTTYAGPVYLEAAGRCVDWGGVIGDAWVVRNGTNCG
ncbi:spore-associated protein A [Nocardiopsis sp. MG754419]|uniref:spore-associated protein A n=1 Tax=Nocardiopsis sp. MG754419 TaxID=2259865 RepID=UPI001BA8C6FE|nr:spore-associated protein A [Nocardiopsis sp. MG754419]MBR8741663.1 spore-associated protein A [Nocardiopsis sp. MG754419]